MESPPKKAKSVDSTRIQQKLVESRLRGIDDENSLEDDRILSFVQMRQMIRVMQRFKGYAFFHKGTDEEHTRYNDKNNVVSHLFYPINMPTKIHKNLELVMHTDKYNRTRTKREKYLLQLKMQDAKKMLTDGTEAASEK